MAVLTTSRPASPKANPTGHRPPPRTRLVAHAAEAAHTRRSRVSGARHIRKRELIPFTRQSAGMLNAGMSIVATIGTLQEQATHPGFRALLSKLQLTIESGSLLSEGMAQFPQVFNEMYVNMVRAGERSGQFADLMKRLAFLLDTTARVIRKVKSAMIYPLVVLSLAMLIAVALVTFVVPVFRELFVQFGSQLPAPTRALMAVSDFIGRNWAYLLAGLIVCGWIIRSWAKTDGGRRTLHRTLLRLPVFGPLVLKVVIARFARLLGQMLTSGVPILDAMSITARACGNVVIEESLMAARTAVQEGQPVASAMEGRPYLPTLMVRMTAAGEKSGRLDEMLVNVAESYDDEVETTLSTLTAMMEPFLMVALGLIIGGILVAMFMPIFQLSAVLSR